MYHRSNLKSTNLLIEVTITKRCIRPSYTGYAREDKEHLHSKTQSSKSHAISLKLGTTFKYWFLINSVGGLMSDKLPSH